MLEPLIARAPARAARLERLGRIEPAAAAKPGLAMQAGDAAAQLIDAIDIVLAATLSSFFKAVRK
jgi:hypothetical protein